MLRSLILVMLSTLCCLPSRAVAEVAVTIQTPMTQPAWALLQRELIRANTAACREFFARYFDERGYLQCVERWGGDDGPDDAIENCTDWPILHALGAPDVILHLYKKACKRLQRLPSHLPYEEQEYQRHLSRCL